MNHILINISSIPRAGAARLIPRMSIEDRAKVTKAASLLQLTQAQFMRAVLIRAAEEVLRNEQ